MPQHAAACRSMPQRAKIFTWRTFFFIPRRNSEPFIAQTSQNWMVAQCPGFHSRQGYFAACQFLYSDLRFFGVVLTCQVLKDTQNTKASQVLLCQPRALCRILLQPVWHGGMPKKTIFLC